MCHICLQIKTGQLFRTGNIQTSENYRILWPYSERHNTCFGKKYLENVRPSSAHYDDTFTAVTTLKASQIESGFDVHRLSVTQASGWSALGGTL